MNTRVPQPEGSRPRFVADVIGETIYVRSYYCFTLEQAITALQQARVLTRPFDSELDPIIALLQRKLKEA